MKTIFDILRLWVKTPIEDEIYFELNNFRIYLDEYLEIKLQSDKWWFSFPGDRKKIISVDKPDKTGNFDTIMLDWEIFDDLFTMDDNQLILTYGRFYPEYLSGDLTGLYDRISKEINS